jgi:hypothetical protein
MTNYGPPAMRLSEIGVLAGAALADCRELLALQSDDAEHLPTITELALVSIAASLYLEAARNTPTPITTARP